MPSYEASAVTKASAEAAWSAWTDVEGWSAYDHIEAARVGGAFQPGAAITSKAKGFPSSTLTVTRVEPPSLWVDESRSPGMKMTFAHVVEPSEGGTRLTERVHISGPLGRALGPLIRRKLEALFAASVAAVARQAEAAEARSQPPTS
jgi:Polyketide cyclase / dehydrase and lipid transport